MSQLLTWLRERRDEARVDLHNARDIGPDAFDDQIRLTERVQTYDEVIQHIQATSL